MRPRPHWIVLAGAVALAGCSSSSRLHGAAAEPAKAPLTSQTPAGTVRSIGAAPEGIVYDRRTGLLAVAVRGPSRLLLLDARTLAVRRSVALPGTVRHLQLAAPGGPVLVPDESAGELIEVSLPDGSARASKVGKQPHDASAVAGGQIVVGNEFGKSLSFVKDGRVLATVPEVRQPGGVIGDGRRVAVIDVAAFTLSEFDVATRTRTAQVPAGAGPTHGVLTAQDRIVVADTRGGALLVFALHPLKQIGRLTLPGRPYGMAIDTSTDTAWVTLTATNQVVDVDVSGARPKLIARYPTVRQPNTVAVAPGSHTVWITGTADGQLQTISR